MNYDFFGFPNRYGLHEPIDIAEFDKSGAYRIPTNAVALQILLIGAGGGAGGVTVNAGRGGNGGLYGGGGGGGGCQGTQGSVLTSGAGGNGAQGIVIVTTYF